MSPPLERYALAMRSTRDCGGIVADETNDKLEKRNFGSGRTGGKHLEQLTAFRLAVIFEFFAEDLFISGLVAVASNFNWPPRWGLIDSPAG